MKSPPLNAFTRAELAAAQEKAQQIKLNREKEEKETFRQASCVHCQKTFRASPKQVFCSDSCRATNWTEKKKLEQEIAYKEALLWKEVIIEQLMVAGIYQSRFDSEPREALAALIAWEVSIALDPTASSAAQALIDQGKMEAQKDLIDNPAELS
jgi:hypothetical protein